MKNWKAASIGQVERLGRAWMGKDAEFADAMGDVAGEAILLSMIAPPDSQWAFIVAAVAAADTDEQLAEIGVGPMEHLLWKHGEAFIERFEAHAADDPKFARAVCNMWRHGMSDDVWARVQSVKARVAEARS